MYQGKELHVKKIYHVLSVGLLMIITVFALINNAPISVNIFGFARLESSVTIVMLVCLAAGVILRPLIIPVKKYNDTDTS